MRFPKLRPQAPKTLKVSDLAGGLNLRDGYMVPRRCFKDKTGNLY